MVMANVIDDAEKKLLNNNFLKQSDGEFIKQDWTVRLFPNYTIDAYNDDYYWGGNIYDVKVDDIIEDINSFIKK